jgi:hypothetical protein
MDVVWVPSDGGDATLTVPARGTGRPHFTHDAERMYGYSNQGLQSFRWDGTDRRTIIKVEGRSRGPQPTPAMGRLHPCRYVLHDRDTKFCATYRSTLADAGVKTIRLPARRPNLNVFEVFRRWRNVEWRDRNVYFAGVSGFLSSFLSSAAGGRKRCGKTGFALASSTQV